MTDYQHRTVALEDKDPVAIGEKIAAYEAEHWEVAAFVPPRTLVLKRAWPTGKRPT